MFIYLSYFHKCYLSGNIVEHYLVYLVTQFYLNNSERKEWTRQPVGTHFLIVHWSERCNDVIFSQWTNSIDWQVHESTNFQI